ncbi:hypothetical protein NP493_42g04003 [Ridgeia piscesae]|uniref:Uncharacterized protein n=1 Tax=Ridgeia piscesae TaxID=27915 RepID=A0AAD9PBU9_RIDPI|nr:hypothetical protein NP493_42g04003 [Ridgeia piscesae]
MESGATRPTLRDKSPEAGTRGSSYSTPLGTPRGKVDDWRGTGFSNSWPDPQMFEEVIPPHKHFLDPISDDS